MDGRFIARAAALLLIGMLYWFAVARTAGVAEPWDAPDYARLWYPGSLVLSIAAGWIVRERAWAAGAILILAQIPVVWLQAPPGPLWPAGLLFAALLAVPAAILSALAGRLASGKRNRDRTR